MKDGFFYSLERKTVHKEMSDQRSKRPKKEKKFLFLEVPSLRKKMRKDSGERTGEM